MALKQEQVHGDHAVEIMFIVFGSDISWIGRTREISLHKNNHMIPTVITNSLVLVIIHPVPGCHGATIVMSYCTIVMSDTMTTLYSTAKAIWGTENLEW